MNLKLQKFIGWSLLIGGLALILWALYSSYNIFTAKTLPPEIFKIAKNKTPLPQKGTPDLEAKMQEMIGEQLKGLIPAESLPNLLNLIAWSIFASISIFAGSQIAGLGIKLLKK